MKKRLLSLLSIVVLMFALMLPSPALAAATPSPTEAQTDQKACADVAVESEGGSESGNTKVGGATTRALETVTGDKG
ncbi:MAG: hypothetical protein WBN80_04630 [Prochlorococcaceae cyanobacterium]